MRFYSRVSIADLSTMNHLNAKLSLLTLETEKRAFRGPQFAYISVTFLFTSDSIFKTVTRVFTA